MPNVDVFSRPLSSHSDKYSNPTTNSDTNKYTYANTYCKTIEIYNRSFPASTSSILSEKFKFKWKC